MKTNNKRLLSLVLVFCMMFTMLPTSAFAADIEGAAQAVCTELAGCVDGTHDVECPLYEAPHNNDVDSGAVPDGQEPESEEPQPLCAELEGCMDGVHDAECPLYVAPENSEEEPQAVCAELAGCVDGTHNEECVLYTAPQYNPLDVRAFLNEQKSEAEEPNYVEGEVIVCVRGGASALMANAPDAGTRTDYRQSFDVEELMTVPTSAVE